jgi:hypothetical protein
LFIEAYSSNQLNLDKEEEAMDSNSVVIIVVIAFFALIVISAFFVFRKRAKIKINTPIGKLDIDATNETKDNQPAIRISEAESTGGGILAEDNQGGGIDINRVKVADDIIATSTKKK